MQCPSCKSTVGVGAQRCQQCGQSMSVGALIAAAYPNFANAVAIVFVGGLICMYLAWCR